MTTTLLKNVQFMDPRGFFEQTLDLYLKDGIIKKIAPKIDDPADKELDLTGKWICPGFVDVHVHLRDPGFPEKETLETGSQAAIAGGFTHLVAMANTKPIMDNPQEIQKFYQKAEKMPIYIYTVSGLTKALRGKELVDMEGAIKAGALGFSDDGFPLTDMGILHQAFQKALELDVPLSFHEEDPKFMANQGISSGLLAESMGMGGAEPFSEYSFIARDGALALKYGTKVDIQHISTKAGACLVKTYYDLGANILGEFTPHHLNFTTDIIKEHGPNARMNPPLRLQEDVEGLRDLLKENCFVLATDHAPHTAQEKSRPFKSSPSGIVGLEVAFPMAYKATVEEEKATIKELLEAMTYRPADFYSLPYWGLEEGKEANFNIIDPDMPWTIDKDTWKGKSSNSPYEGQEVKGKILGTFVKGQWHQVK